MDFAGAASDFVARFSEDVSGPDSVEEIEVSEFRLWLHPKRRRNGVEWNRQTAPLIDHLRRRNAPRRTRRG